MIKIKRLTIFVVLCCAAFLAIWNIIAPKFTYQAPSTQVASALKPSQPLKPFSLLDTNGRNFSEKSLRGHWTLIFFGYMQCPDICPKTLGILRDSWQLFATKNQAAPVRFVFADISRHVVANSDLKQFLRNFNQDFIGISGTPEQMHTLSDQLGIYAQQQDNKLDHTAALMLIDPQGRLTAVFTPPFSAEDIANDLSVLTL